MFDWVAPMFLYVATRFLIFVVLGLAFVVGLHLLGIMK
jgi:hypothetical protein